MLSSIEPIGGRARVVSQRRDQFRFVEYSDKLSAFGLLPSTTIVSQGTATLKGTFSFDFDAGIENTAVSPAGLNYDIFWEQVTPTTRIMTLQNNAQMINLGSVSFDDIPARSLQSLPYRPVFLDKLTVSDVFAIKTTSRNYAKVLIAAADSTLQIQWATYRLT